MDGLNRSSTERRRRVHLVQVVLAAAIAIVGLVALPGTASATATVTPLLDCYTVHEDGSWTAVFGYDNPTGAAVTIAVGPDNKVTPVTSGTPQPTSFQPGVHHGVFSVTVVRGAGPMWHLDGQNLAARKSRSSACPASTELPADGNGTGPVIALGIAGVIGVAMIHRVRRRNLAATVGTPVTERGDA